MLQPVSLLHSLKNFLKFIHCCMLAFSSCSSGGYSVVAGHWLLTMVASLVVGMGSRQLALLVAARGLSSVADPASQGTCIVPQSVKKLPVIQETCVRSPGREDPLEKGMATHSSVLAWRIHTDRGAWRATVHGVTQSQA